MDKMRKFTFTILLLLIANIAAAHTVRVRLFDGKGLINTVSISSDSPVVASTPEGLVLADGWEVKATTLGMLLEGGPNPVELPGPIEFSVENAALPLLTVKANGLTRRYRGKITISPLAQNKGLLVINSLPQEEYLYGVVPGEVPASWPYEALRAQAILARTYSFNHLSPNRDYDLVDSTNSQVYMGFDHEKPTTNRAVDETADLVVGYEGKVVPYVYYFSTCGGQTEDSGQVWGTAVPYLIPTSCSAQLAQDLSDEEAAVAYFATPQATYCSRSSVGRWEVLLTAEDLAAITTGLCPDAEFVDLLVTRRASGGAVLEVSVTTTKGDFKISGELNIRRKLGKNGQSLRSSFFALQKQLNEEDCTVEYLLRGGGWGHRVGVCQWGMEGMARQGASAAEILGHFLPGTQILSLADECGKLK